MDKLQIYQIHVFINGITMLTDVLSHDIVRHVQPWDGRYPVWYTGSTYHPVDHVVDLNTFL